MTLILASGNTQNVVLVSDRRFTAAGRVFHDEKNKVIVFACLDARLALAFTGLAEAGSFKTADWLWRSLSEAAKPDYRMLNTIARLAEKASTEWVSVPAQPREKRVSIVA